MRLLVVGGSGLLGRAVVRQARGPVVATFHSSRLADPPADWRQLDVRRRDDVARVVADSGADVVVNTAYRQADWATTAGGAVNIALAGVRMVHVSSDVVFSGRAHSYTETAMPDPTTPYGAAKAAAETAIRALSPGSVIARTSLIVGHGESQHERYVHSRGPLFIDDVRCPVHVDDLAAALLELAASSYAGVHHVAGADAVSRYELGVLIARRDGLDPRVLRAGRRAVTGPSGPLAVRLDSSWTQTRLSIRLRGAREFLRP